MENSRTLKEELYRENTKSFSRTFIRTGQGQKHRTADMPRQSKSLKSFSGKNR